MTYAELMRFSCALSQLGYQSAVSVDSFRVPNFQLLADVVSFLIKIVAPESRLAPNIGTPEDRVYFITTAVTLFQTHYCLKLNAKRLYAADVSAVRELVKVTDEAVSYGCFDQANFDGDAGSAVQGDLTAAAGNLRGLAGDLVRKSSDLVLSLKQFGDSAPSNLQQALNKQPDVRQLQQAVQSRIQVLEEEASKFTDELQVNRKEKINMQELLTQKQADLQRMTDRLESMRTTRPPFIVELEQQEAELTRIHQEYAKKHRSLAFLESQLRSSEQVLKQKRERQLKDRDIIKHIVDGEKANMLQRGGAEVMGSADDPFMHTPGPNQVAAIPVTTGAVELAGEGEYYEEYEEEGEADGEQPAPEAAQGTRAAAAMPQHFVAGGGDVSFSDDGIRNADEDYEEEAEPEVPEKPAAPAPKPEVAEDEYEYYEEGDEPVEDAKEPAPQPAEPQPKKEEPAAAPAGNDEEEYYEYYEEYDEGDQ